MVRLAGHGAEHGHPDYLPFLGLFGGNNRSWPFARAATHPGRLEANAWLMRRCGGDWDWYRVSQNPQRPYILKELLYAGLKIIKEPWSLSGVPYMPPPFFKDQRLERWAYPFLCPKYTLYRYRIEALKIVSGTLIDLYRGLLNL